MEILGFIGSGNMAEALIRGLLRAKIFEPQRILVSDIRGERLGELEKKYGVRGVKNNCELVKQSDIVVLSVKPQNMAEVLEEIKGALKGNTLIISIAAGITTGRIRQVLGKRAVIRVMPNMPALAGEGASALFATDEAAGDIERAAKLFSSVGKAAAIEDENLMDAVTAVSGSGPAYYFLVMEEMIAAAVELGLDKETAKELVLQTAKGSAELALTADIDNRSPSELRKNVTSPGGTTEAALEVLTKGGFGQLLRDAIHKARDRSRQLSGS
ncbi:MAG: pyrroline-5-carboxylate reductase [Planctomycetota bacterium]